MTSSSTPEPVYVASRLRPIVAHFCRSAVHHKILDTRFTQTNQNTTNFSRLSTGSHVNNFLSRNKVSRVDRGDNIPSCSEHQSTSSVINRQAQLPLGRKIQQHRPVSLESIARQPLRKDISNIVAAGPVLHAKRALFDCVLNNDRTACIAGPGNWHASSKFLPLPAPKPKRHATRDASKKEAGTGRS